MKTFKAISSGILFFAMASQVAYLKFGDALEARFPLIKQLKANVAATRGPADPADVYALRPDGSAVDPKGYRKALMADRRALAAIGRESPEWKNVVERGTAAEFQDMLREGHRTRAAEEAARATAALREPDGSATHPEAYRELWTSDAKRMAGMRRDAPQMYATVKFGDVDAFQEMLREMKRVEDGARTYGRGGSTRAVGADGAEALVDLKAPRLTDEEIQSPALPARMLCAACQGVAHQFAASIASTRAAPTNGEPLAGCLLEKLQALCADGPVWTDAYGLQPGLDGAAVLVGPGIHQANAIETSDVEIATQHSVAAGSRLAAVCHHHLADHDESDMLAHLDAGKTLDTMLCRNPGQPCGAPKAPRKKRKKKKKKKKKAA